MQLRQSAVTTLNDLAKSFKESYDLELDLPMLNHVLNDSLLLSDDQIKRIYENTQAQSESRMIQSKACVNYLPPSLRKFLTVQKGLRVFLNHSVLKDLLRR